MRAVTWCGLLVAVAFLQVGRAGAAVTCRLTSGNNCIVEVTGVVAPGDHDEILRRFEPHAPISGLTPIEPNEARISLNSEGGSVQEALKIGRLLRSREFTAIVPLKGRCLSSCVFVLMGAVKRQVYGTVGIHRPYFGRYLPDTKPEHVVREFDAMRGRLYDYAHEMRIPEALIDLMYSIDPANMAVLAEEDLSYYGLNRIDPAFEEVEIMKEAKLLRVTPSEYRQRMHLVEKFCDPLVPDQLELYSACYAATRLGLTLEEFESWRIEFGIQVDASWPDDRKRDCYTAIMIQGRNTC